MATQSGHVFIRSRNAKSGQSSTAKMFKFQRVPYLQRVIGVCANNTGAFGALRVDYHPPPAHVLGNTPSQCWAMTQPYLRCPGVHGFETGPSKPRQCLSGFSSPTQPTPLEIYDEGEDLSIQTDIRNLERLCLLLGLDTQARKGPKGRLLFDGVPLAYGADLMVQSPSGSEFPVHRVWLAARSPILCEILSRMKTLQDTESEISLRLAHSHRSTSSIQALPRLSFGGCNSMSILILLTYLYSDELLSLWDHRIDITLKQQLLELNIQPQQVRLELQALARILDLPKLAEAVQSPGKRIPAPSVAIDMQRLAWTAEKQGINDMHSVRSPLCPDVIIQLRDREVLCHSVVLRAGSSFFAAFFDDRDWTARRWDEYGAVKIDMKHWNWRIMQFPLRFLCAGFETAAELFDLLG